MKNFVVVLGAFVNFTPPSFKVKFWGLKALNYHGANLITWLSFLFKHIYPGITAHRHW